LCSPLPSATAVVVPPPLPAAAICRRPALFTRLSLHLMRRCTEKNIPTPRSSKPRLQPPPRRVSGLPSARLWRTSSPPPHRRQRAPGELRVVVLFLPVQTPSQTVHHSSECHLRRGLRRSAARLRHLHCHSSSIRHQSRMISRVRSTSKHGVPLGFGPP
jgi:hypothetical protein